ncbi:AraC family transcriptional regulator [Paenibacillus sp. J5C_2022]|uniref:AraC family transcriptional regulator n=1 Tax=Paenibacillus sp. J5C2022 TaxID=2977129 RepID=UPI0021D31F82|nr:AraC family transcriptional regulator [Paenibacillus sp. J5C2022]MCU6708674.1 AraC family transcriptional regulator [Paenibacillus sp. J5C2022]
MNGIHCYEAKHLQGYTIKEHMHDYYQLLYVIEGEGALRLDGKSRPLGAGHAAVIPPHASHSVASDNGLTLLVLAYDKESAGEHAMPQGLQKPWTSPMHMKLNVMAAGELRLLLRKALFEQKRMDAFSEWALRIHLQAMLLLLARAEQSALVTDADGLRAERIRDYIDSHYYEPLTLRDLAYKLGVSTRHTTTIFKKQYHQTPMHYLTEVRIGVAKKLLAETEGEIASICFEIGYESVPAFYRAFKNSAGMSPHKYRLQQQHGAAE